MTVYSDIQSRLQGSMVALVTPMLSTGEIDYPKLSDLIDWHISEGTHCLVAVGTTGESATLSMQEHSDVIRYFVKHVNGRVPVIAGTGANNTKEAIKLTTDAYEAGADCALLVAPYYNKPTQEGLYQHYKAISDAVKIPQMLYNVPGRTVVDISQNTVERLADIDNIVAIKDATGCTQRGKKLIETVGDRLVVLSGDDHTALKLTQLGGKGNISVTANIVPNAMSQAFSLALAGKLEEALAVHATIEPLHRLMFVESSPIPAKYALHKMGKIDNGIRLPLTWLNKKYHSEVDAGLRDAGLIG